MKQLEIRSLKQAKQACMNAVLRGLAHQKWLSDGVAWSEKNHGSLEPDEHRPGIAFYSSLGWLVQKGLHKRVFEPRNTEVGLLTWSYEGVIHNSHPQLVSWNCQYLQSLETIRSRPPYYGYKPNRFIQFLHELHTAYVEGRHEPRKLFESMRDMVATHKLKWPEDVLLPPVFPTHRTFSKYMSVETRFGKNEFRIVHVVLDPFCKDQIAIGALTSEGFVQRPNVIERVRGYCAGAVDSHSRLVESVLRDLNTVKGLDMPNLSPHLKAGPVQTPPNFDTEVYGLKQFVSHAMFPS